MGDHGVTGQHGQSHMSQVTMRHHVRVVGTMSPHQHQSSTHNYLNTTQHWCKLFTQSSQLMMELCFGFETPAVLLTSLE